MDIQKVKNNNFSLSECPLDPPYVLIVQWQVGARDAQSKATQTPTPLQGVLAHSLKARSLDNSVILSVGRGRIEPRN